MAHACALIGTKAATRTLCALLIAGGVAFGAANGVHASSLSPSVSDALASATASQPAEPPVPTGIAPSDPVIALVGSGIDYTRPKLAERLARDGEGLIIGQDAIDNDLQPYGTGFSNLMAEVLATNPPPVTLAPYRLAPDVTENLMATMAHIAWGPAEIVLLEPGFAEEIGNRALLFEAAVAMPERLFIAPVSHRPETPTDPRARILASQRPSNLVWLIGQAEPADADADYAVAPAAEAKAVNGTAPHDAGRQTPSAPLEDIVRTAMATLTTTVPSPSGGQSPSSAPVRPGTSILPTTGTARAEALLRTLRSRD